MHGVCAVPVYVTLAGHVTVTVDVAAVMLNKADAEAGETLVSPMKVADKGNVPAPAEAASRR